MGFARVFYVRACVYVLLDTRESTPKKCSLVSRVWRLSRRIKKTQKEKKKKKSQEVKCVFLNQNHFSSSSSASSPSEVARSRVYKKHTTHNFAPQ